MGVYDLESLQQGLGLIRVMSIEILKPYILTCSFLVFYGVKLYHNIKCFNLRETFFWDCGCFLSKNVVEERPIYW